jgi:hypothetical protein
MCACHGFEQGAYTDVTANPNRLHGLTGYRWEAQARSNQVPLYGWTALVWRWWCFPLRVSGMPELVVALEKRVQAVAAMLGVAWSIERGEPIHASTTTPKMPGTGSYRRPTGKPTGTFLDAHSPR